MQLSADDGGLTRPVPSVVEYVGLAAGLVPFVASHARTDARTVDGVVVAARYRDWIALGGGARRRRPRPGRRRA